MASKHEELSIFLCRHLRHRPRDLSISLDSQGWTDIDILLQRCQDKGRAIDRSMLMEIVATDEKTRYAVSPDGGRIRCLQGHSAPEVKIIRRAAPPPVILYHGTAEKSLDAILREGIEARKRHQVHLSTDVAEAINVGRRHGKPVVLRVRAGHMQLLGHKFYCSENGVWLTDAVPKQFLSKVDMKALPISEDLLEVKRKRRK